MARYRDERWDDEDPGASRMWGLAKGIGLGGALFGAGAVLTSTIVPLPQHLPGVGAVEIVRADRANGVDAARAAVADVAAVRALDASDTDPAPSLVGPAPARLEGAPQGPGSPKSGEALEPREASLGEPAIVSPIEAPPSARAADARDATLQEAAQDAAPAPGPGPDVETAAPRLAARGTSTDAVLSAPDSARLRSPGVDALPEILWVPALTGGMRLGAAPAVPRPAPGAVQALPQETFGQTGAVSPPPVGVPSDMRPNASEHALNMPDLDLPPLALSRVPRITEAGPKETPNPTPDPELAAITPDIDLVDVDVDLSVLPAAPAVDPDEFTPVASANAPAPELFAARSAGEEAANGISVPSLSAFVANVDLDQSPLADQGSEQSIGAAGVYGRVKASAATQLDFQIVGLGTALRSAPRGARSQAVLGAEQTAVGKSLSYPAEQAGFSETRLTVAATSALPVAIRVQPALSPVEASPADAPAAPERQLLLEPELAALPTVERVLSLPGPALSVNARLFSPPGDARLMAVVLRDAGSGALPDEALNWMTMPLTLALRPDGPAGRAFASLGRAAGHEVIVDLPMSQPGSGSAASQSLIDQRMDGSDLGRRTSGFLAEFDMAIGATAPANAPLLRDRMGMRAVLQPILKHGFAWIDPKARIGSQAAATARSGALAWAAADRWVPDGASEGQVYRSLVTAAFQARRQGDVIVFLPASLDSLKAIIRWGLEQGGQEVWFSPLSSVLARRSAE